MIRDYVAFDLEMTGTQVKSDRILEIGACRVRNGVMTDTFQTFAYPGREIPEFIVGLTGIHDEDVKDAPSQEEAVRAFLKFAGNDVLMGHNVNYDYSFIKVGAVNFGLPFENLTLDTLKMARAVLPEEQSKKLESLTVYFGIEHKAHRALQDAIATHEVYEHLLAAYEVNPAFQNVAVPRPLDFSPKKSQPATKGQILRLQKLSKLYHEKLTVDVKTLTRSEASRLADQMAARHGIIREKDANGASFSSSSPLPPAETGDPR